MAGRDADRTRMAIFEAALAEFAALGPAGARVDAIAGAAGVNKRMLYHYFGSKEGLYAALREAQVERLDAAMFQRGEPVGEQLARSQLRQVSDGDWARLSVWEALGGSDAESPAQASAWQAAVVALGLAQDDGEVAADLEPRQLLLSMVALVMFPVAFPRLSRMIAGVSPNDPAFTRARTTFLKALGARLSGAPGSKPRYRLNATTRLAK